jgi:PAS domain S-box-containing protein
MTERNIAEREKKRGGMELQSFIDTANVPIFGIDSAATLVNEWNNKAVEITSFTRQEVVGRDLVQGFITEEYRGSVRKVLDDAVRGKETANFEFALYTKNKRRVDVLLNATTRRDLSGDVVGMLGVGQDIMVLRRLLVQESVFCQAQAENEAESRFLTFEYCQW